MNAPADPSGLPTPTAVLPHRPPFLFLDRVESLVGDVARGEWVVPTEAPFFDGHFPGRPIVPGVLLVESIAQLGAYAVLMRRHLPGIPLLGGVDRTRFRRAVLPGDVVTVEIELVQMSARSGRGRGHATVAGKRAAEADILFVFADDERAR